jgi:tRNA 2-thiouridine synthesizing protein B
VNKSPFDRPSLTSCLETARPDDPILLLEDGVIAAQEGTKYAPKVKAAMKTNPIYAIRADLKLRGIEDKVIEGINVCDYSCFVSLATEHKVMPWL